MSKTEEKKPEVIALLIQGKTLGEVQKATGVSKSAIWRIKEQIKEHIELVKKKESEKNDE
jgi:DNA invertase Pin-like site-specific DNA recombinase